MKNNNFLLIIPCKNEESRVDLTQFKEFKDLGVDILFIDDGSGDKTFSVLDSTFKSLPEFNVLRNKKNLGKSRCIQIGICYGMKQNYNGFITLDADMTYSREDLEHLLLEAQKSEFNLIIKSRVNLQGWDVRRSPKRIWASRAVSTYLFFLIRSPIYDLQSPLKFYRNTNELSGLMQYKIRTRWFFDAELIIRDTEGFYRKSIEYPIKLWNDTPTKNFGFKGAMLTLKDQFALLIIKLQNLNIKAYR